MTNDDLVDNLAHEADRPYVTVFTVEVCVRESDAAEAQERALAWGMDNLSETVVLTPGDVVLPDCEPGTFPVSLTGTLNFIGPDQATVDERVRETLAAVRRAQPSWFVHMGDFRTAPVPYDETRVANAASTL
jgi:hypothetical protein